MSSQGSEERGLSCPLCGQELVEVHCKAWCPQRHYFEDCSDVVLATKRPYPWDSSA